tara:strand:+ start:467 stop:670 length:204 start_codon:yes stop_codon:yes gene_type:complete
MTKNFTQFFLNSILKKENNHSSDKNTKKNHNKTHGPSKYTIDVILGYANSIKVIETKLDKDTFISLN